MHELNLYGQVTFARYEQVLNILAGVAAMQPQRIYERHIVYKPLREPEEPGSNLGRRGGTQTVAQKQAKQAAPVVLYHTQLVQKLSEADFAAEDSPPQESGKPLSAEVDEGEEPVWSFVFKDIPDTGDRGVSIRFTNTTDLLSGDPHAHMLASGPNQLDHLPIFVTEYYVEGYRFVHGNVVIFLHRILHEPGVRNIQKAPKTTLPTFTGLKLLDPSGAYVLDATVQIEDFNNAAVLEAGVNELKRFQTQMKGCVNLVLPDRLAQDSRVKYKPPPPPATQARPR
ncbi:rna polymerase ii mediator complex subunit [Stemphylium lycopersici]|nr:rna polymerase ii mediator complex subunit [Stemphylium lycopersici]RAR11559.1 rna polymerase ii mediator complex subunit [Stemphylium lycopersici]